ncbi:DUF4097 family beta strand repeat-containing protein [Gracilimonas mengyeensis]|uniref:Adhesin n=1 Tax=Gracilimonas mengyeensis TaxID=1302730 RepID=A0A521CXJ4_9BACT|nr:DUF4097 family beta strand repeat-containing protein [Gracilimonas mengyeensis]SMO64159.1 Putative adhesin [Gracilimonas mengyeensis]
MNAFKFSPTRLFAYLIPAFLIVSTQCIQAQSARDVYSTESFSVSSGEVSLEVQTSGGSIKVLGTETDEVVVEMYVRKRGKYMEPGEADLSDYDISSTQDGNTIRVIADRESSGWGWNSNSISISYIVYAPVETRTRLRTSGGSLTARNLEGSQELRTSGGSITTEGIHGKMSLKTSGGSINIADAQGNTEANTSGGTIRVDAFYGNLDVKTSGGSIRLKGIEGNVEARTSGGSINAEVLAPSEYVDLKTSGGSITVTVPEELGYDLELDANRVSVDLRNFNGSAERDEVEGSMNGGGIRIEAKTSGGSVSLKYL